MARAESLTGSIDAGAGEGLVGTLSDVWQAVAFFEKQVVLKISDF